MALRFAVFLAASVLLQTTLVAAQDSTTASDQSLRALRNEEVQALAPLLDGGVVMHAVFRDREELMPEVTLITRVRAPADRVAAIIADPAHYPEFMSSLDELEVESSQGNQTSYRWTWKLAFFEMHGRNSMVVYPPHPERGHRIDVRSTGGDLGFGRFSWRIRSDGPDSCILMLASRIDMRGANFISDQLAAGGVAVQRSMNVILSTVMLLGTQARAEGQRQAAPQTALTRPTINAAPLYDLLNAGDLVWLERNGEAIGRVSVFSRMGASVARTREVMADPEEFGRSLIQGSVARITAREANHVDFEWGVPLPLVGIEGEMRLTTSPAEIQVSGLQGSMRTGRWFFDTVTMPGDEALVVGWARFNPAEASRLIRMIVSDDPAMSHGLALATEVMIVRSLRLRALGWVRG